MLVRDHTNTEIKKFCLESGPESYNKNVWFFGDVHCVGHNKVFSAQVHSRALVEWSRV